MSSVESRIVTMKFENSAFERGVSTTLSTLAKLKDSLASSFSGGKGLTEVGTNAEKANAGVSHLGASVDGINAKFIALSTVAITALASISAKAFQTGSDLVQSLSGFQAAQEGFSDYELKIGATQTIMAGTGETIGFVSKQLKELDIYADQTIYSLADMTQNIGKFTNAGVKLPVAVDALKGVAQVAALSGANSNEAARAMYNLGQAIGQGKVRLMDWKSVELANMGTKEFKEQLIDAAVATGTLNKAADGTITTLDGAEVTFKNFATTLEKDWLTAGVLTDTLGKYADETTAIGKKATKAATEVKTFSMMMETLRAAAGTGWTDTFETVIGNLPQATRLWTGLTNEIGGFIGASADARNEMLKDWAKLGGRKDLIESIKNVWEGLGSVLGPIRDAFREIFPRTTGEELASLTEKIRAFTEHLRLSPEAGEALKRTFKGLFAIVHIFTTILGRVIGFVFSLFSAFEGGDGGILSVTASIGDLIVAFDKWLSTSKDVDAFFDTISAIGRAVLIPLIGTVMRVYDAIGLLLSGDISGFTDKLGSAFDFLSSGFEELGSVLGSVGGVVDRFVAGIENGFGSVAEIVATVEASFGGIDTNIDDLANKAEKLGVFKIVGLAIAGAFIGAYKAIGPILSGIGELASAIQDFLVRIFQTSDGTDALAAANTAAFVGMYLTIRKYVGTVDDFLKSFMGVGRAIEGTFEQLTGSLQTMQTAVRAKLILNIAIAVGILAASLAVLAFIPMDKLQNGLTAIGTLMASLGVLMAAMSVEKLGIGGLGLLTASAAMIAVATAVGILAGALRLLEGVGWDEMGKLGAMMAGLVAAVYVMGMAGPTAILAAGALLILAPAMLMMVGAVAAWAVLDWGTFAKGGAMMAITVAALGLALNLFSPTAILGAAAILILAPALLALTGVIAIFGNMDTGTLAKGLIAMSLALLAIAVAANAMTGALAGAAAMFIMAAALKILIEPLSMLGEMDPGTLIKIGIALAGLFAILGIAGTVLIAAVPGLLGLGVALALLGAAMLMAGGGMLAFATGFAILAATGTAGVAVLTATVIALAGLIPLIAEQIGLAIVAIAKVIAEAGPVLIKAFETLIRSMLRAAVRLMPEFRAFGLAVLQVLAEVIIARAPILGRALSVLIRVGLQVIRSYFVDFVNTGIDLIMELLDGITRSIPKIGAKVTLLITTFLRELGRNGVKLARGAADALIDFLNGLADAIRDKSGELRQAGANIGSAIVEGLIGGLDDLAGSAISKAQDIAGDVVDALGDAAGMLGSPSRFTHFIGTMLDQGLINGMDHYADRAVASATTVGDRTVEALRNSMSAVGDAVNGEMNLDPTITPVLDLTNLQNDASRIDSLLNTVPMTTDVSYGRAVALMNEQQAQSEPFENEGGEIVKQVNYTQNNYSPKAISPVETYRHGKDLVELKKEELGL